MKKKNWFLIGFFALIIIGGLTYRYFARDVDSRGTTKLMRAIRENSSLKNTDKLIKKSADINVKDKQGQTALFYAVRHAQDIDVLQRLLSAGAQVSIEDKNGDTPLLLAARVNPSAEVIESLIYYGADVNAPDKKGNVPLVLAARHNKGKVIEQLLRSNAKLNVKSKDGKTLADLLAENEKLSEQEKANYQQLFLIISILESRQKEKDRFNPYSEIEAYPYDVVQTNDGTPLEEVNAYYESTPKGADDSDEQVY